MTCIQALIIAELHATGMKWLSKIEAARCSDGQNRCSI
jgi:hypothetical protein